MMRRALLFIFSSSAALAQSRPAPERVAARVAEIEPQLVELRLDLHRHPETSGNEARTAGVVAERLRRLGLEIRTGVGGHGVVALLRGSRPGPLVAYRADMDAVPSTAEDPAPVRSLVAGVRHICGHDLHVAVGVGLATALAGLREELSGSVMFIFQPAEERATGARAMLDAGVFTGDRPVAIYGIHTAPLEVGQIASRSGRMMLANPAAPGVVNDSSLFLAARSSVTSVIGAASFIEVQNPPAGFSEDFGHFQSVVPGVFFFVGASRASRGIVAAPHSPAFQVDDAAIGVAVRAMAAVLLDRLARR